MLHIHMNNSKKYKYIWIDSRKSTVVNFRKCQFDRIFKNTEKVLDGDTTLGEKIRTIFKEHGITVVAILEVVDLEGEERLPKRVTRL